MGLVYLAGIRIYGLLISVLSLFNDKARKWREGRRGLLDRVAREVDASKRSIWFHFASLGEFEQGRPVLERLRALKPDRTFIITFYSPSGYEIRKNTPLADHVFYLPEDTPRNAFRFIELINPELAIFTKYEYWPFFFRELGTRQIPLYVISAIFRPGQVYFKWYGGFFRNTLKQVTHFFTQNRESVMMLSRLGINKATLAGDTRFDRVVDLPQNRLSIAEAKDFSTGHRVLVAGSTWPADEELLAGLHQHFPDWKLIIAPHEIHEDRIRSVMKLFPQAIRFSAVRDPGLPATKPDPSVLIIDNIGMLSSLYGYGRIAYVGGGFGAGIHNTLEAATYGIPVIFGPNYHKFKEADDLIARGAGFSVEQLPDVTRVFGALQQEESLKTAGDAARQYVLEHAGATIIIIKHLIEEQFGGNMVSE